MDNLKRDYEKMAHTSLALACHPQDCWICRSRFWSFFFECGEFARLKVLVRAQKYAFDHDLDMTQAMILHGMEPGETISEIAPKSLLGLSDGYKVGHVDQYVEVERVEKKLKADPFFQRLEQQMKGFKL